MKKITFGIINGIIESKWPKRLKCRKGFYQTKRTGIQKGNQRLIAIYAFLGL